MTSVSQIIMLYTLNFYSAICQLYLNKTGREKIIFISYVGYHQILQEYLAEAFLF